MNKIEEVGTSVIEEVLKLTGDFNWRKTSPDDRKKITRRVGTAAIEAMREPTKEMGLASRMTHHCRCGDRIHQWALNRWEDMLDAALNEK